MTNKPVLLIDKDRRIYNRVFISDDDETTVPGTSICLDFSSWGRLSFSFLSPKTHFSFLSH